MTVARKSIVLRESATVIRKAFRAKQTTTVAATVVPMESALVVGSLPYAKQKPIVVKIPELVITEDADVDCLMIHAQQTTSVVPDIVLAENANVFRMVESATQGGTVAKVTAKTRNVKTPRHLVRDSVVVATMILSVALLGHAIDSAVVTSPLLHSNHPPLVMESYVS